jgi:hypothetical protein
MPAVQLLPLLLPAQLISPAVDGDEVEVVVVT